MKQGGFQILSWHNCGTSGEDIKILRILEAARGRMEEIPRRTEKGSRLCPLRMEVVQSMGLDWVGSLCQLKN